MGLRVQTVNHTLGGRLICGKRDNAHEMAGKPKSAYKVDFFVIDAASMESQSFEDAAQMKMEIRRREQEILAELATDSDSQYAAAAAQVNTAE